MTGNDFIGYAAGVALMMSFIPQVVKTVRTKKAEDISIALIVLSLISGCLYELYAYTLRLVPVIVMNGIFTLSVIVQLVYTMRFRRNRTA